MLNVKHKDSVMNIKVFEFNPVSENTYILYDQTHECVIIDAGCFYPTEKATLTSFIAENNLKVKHLLNTHLHFDHIFGNSFVEEQYGVQTEANAGDEFLLDQLSAQLQMFGFDPNETKRPHIGTYLNEGDVVTFGNQKLQILHVPGHSAGSLVFYNQEANVLLVGDVLFKGSIGRTDLPGGNYEQLIEGIKSKLLTLPPHTLAYSGHGPSTTIAYEIAHNPFLK